jgi:hypothetical protein
MPCVKFEPTIPASERAKTVHALDRSATVTGSGTSYLSLFSTQNRNPYRHIGDLIMHSFPFFRKLVYLISDVSLENVFGKKMSDIVDNL